MSSFRWHAKGGGLAQGLQWCALVLCLCYLRMGDRQRVALRTDAGRLVSLSAAFIPSFPPSAMEFLFSRPVLPVGGLVLKGDFRGRWPILRPA